MPNFTKYLSDMFTNLVNSPSNGGHAYQTTMSSSTSDTEALLNGPNGPHALGRGALCRSRKSSPRSPKSPFPQSPKRSDSPSSPPSYYSSGPTRLHWDTENSMPHGPNPFKAKFDTEYHPVNNPFIRAGRSPETPQRESRSRLGESSYSPQQQVYDGSWVGYPSQSSPPYRVGAPGLDILESSTTPPLSTSTTPQTIPTPVPSTPSPGKNIGLGISGISPDRRSPGSPRSFDGLGRVGMKKSARRCTLPYRRAPSTWRHCIIGGFEDAQEHPSDFASLNLDDDDDTDDEVNPDIFTASFSPPPPVRRHFLRGYEGDLYDPMASLAYDYSSPPEISDAFYEEMVNTWTLDEGSFMSNVLHSIPEEVGEDFEEVDLGSERSLLVGAEEEELVIKDDFPDEFLPSTPMKSQDSIVFTEVSPRHTLPTPPTTPLKDEGMKSSMTLIQVEISLDDFKVDLENPL